MDKTDTTADVRFDYETLSSLYPLSDFIPV